MFQDSYDPVGGSTYQGGALARQLRGLDWNVRATARDIEHPKAKALQDIGVHLTPGDWDDEDALRTALASCTKAFIGYTANLLDFEAAPRRTQRTVRLARETGVNQVIATTTLGTAMLDESKEPPLISPTPLFAQHLASKWRVEQAVEEGGFESWTVLRPGFFMANFLDPKVWYGYADVRMGQRHDAQSGPRPGGPRVHRPVRRRSLPGPGTVPRDPRRPRHGGAA